MLTHLICRLQGEHVQGQGQDPEVYRCRDPDLGLAYAGMLSIMLYIETINKYNHNIFAGQGFN